MPTFEVYVLYSNVLDRFYKGQTSNIDERLSYHLGGNEYYTSRANDWFLVWVTTKENRKEAIALERKLKNLNRMKLLLFMDKYSNELTFQGRELVDKIE
jgi:putative endonuclease